MIDLRSDTVTMPTSMMMEAISNAKLGDDVYEEDPTVNELERLAASMMGTESALLISSGTMGNLIANLIHCPRGTEVILGDLSHTFLYENGGISGLGGIHSHQLPNNDDGTIDITYFAVKDGKEKNIKQKGYVSKDEPARWKVQFMKPYIPFFTAPYEVIILDPDYRYMVVGYPDNSYGWIMCRETSIPRDLYNSVLNSLEVDFGYDKNAFEIVVHRN